jgi:Cu(I)/Ag(I) efflux system membrane protein CusA/SilA
VPLLWTHGAGADTMRRLAVPMIGGLATSFVMELLIYPIIFYVAKNILLWRGFHEGAPPAEQRLAHMSKNGKPWRAL